jgi:hypothetical protein
MIGTEDAEVLCCDGFCLRAHVARSVDAAGAALFTCLLSATGATELTRQQAFVRTLMLTEAEATVSNPWQPGSLPSDEQLTAGLLDTGVRYMKALIRAANRGVSIAGAEEGARVLSVHEARSRTGMTDAALAVRER